MGLGNAAVDGDAVGSEAGTRMVDPEVEEVVGGSIQDGRVLDTDSGWCSKAPQRRAVAAVQNTAAAAVAAAVGNGSWPRNSCWLDRGQSWPPAEASH